MANPLSHAALAHTLPPRLLRFFARFPPPASSISRALQPAEQASLSTTINTSSAESNGTIEETTASSNVAALPYDNPFRNRKHPVTGNWHDPIYSLRRQADLVKLARANGVEQLLPFTTKGTGERIRKRAEHGLRVKGTGVGQRVKGHWSERTMKGRLEKRRQAMLEMPQMIQTWKQVCCNGRRFGFEANRSQRGHGRGWKKFPK